MIDMNIPIKACMSNRSLEVTPVANGYVLRVVGGFDDSRSRFTPQDTYAFANAGSLAAWMEAWGVERARERKEWDKARK